MRFALCWCLLLTMVLAGCAHVDPQSAGSPETKQPVESEKQTSSKVGSSQGETAGPGSVLNLPVPESGLGQPLEEEVTQPPHRDKAEDVLLTPDELQALQDDAEIHFELDIKETDILQDYFIYYTKNKHQVFQRWLKRAEQYLPYIRKVFTQKGLPQDLIFLPFAESGFNPLAYSHAGAAGMWQFMPATGRMFGLESNWWVDERRDPYKSTVAAAEYLHQLYKRFEDWYLVLAAYNAGGGHVSQAMRRCGSSDYFDLASASLLHNETRRYVPKFLAILKIVRNLDTLGFEPIDWEAPAEPNSIQVPPGTDLHALAESVGMKWSEFQARNPFFRRPAAPPEGDSTVYLPAQKIASAKSFLAGANNVASKGVHRYRIKPGDSWWRLSRRFDLPLAELKKFNQASSNTLRPGQWVLIPAPPQTAQHDTVPAGSAYVVKSGDTLWQIARSLDTTVKALRQANPGLSAQQLSVGQKIKLPRQASTRQIASRRANYTVRAGDTLWGIADRFHLSLSSLVQANGLHKDAPLHVGTQLYIPDMGEAQQARARKTAAEARVHYQVQKGDNLWSIARRFGVSPAKIMEWNQLSSRDIIHPGDTLTIYAQ